MTRYTLSKAERLCSIKEIDRLFAEGKSVSKYPLRLVWLEMERVSDSYPPVQVMFSASKKRFKRAVERNRLKRLMREAYRLMKPDWFAAVPPTRSFHIALIYTGSEILSFDEIQLSLAQALKRWQKAMSNTTEAQKEDPIP